MRRQYKSDVKHIIYLQSCLRRRLARKELKALKAEARSIHKFKEISYKLENKVFELTHKLQERNSEKKELQAKIAELELQLQSWVSRHEESDAKAKQLQSDLQMSKRRSFQTARNYSFERRRRNQDCPTETNK